MSELKAYEVYPVVGDNRKIVGSALHDDTEISLYRAQVYLKSEADKVIAEKDAQILDLIEQVQKERSAKGDYKISANDLSDGIKKAYEEIRRLKRALWLARAMRAEAQWNRQLRDAGIAFAIGENKSWDSWNQKQKKWQGVERKCREKAEEYNG